MRAKTVVKKPANVIEDARIKAIEVRLEDLAKRLEELEGLSKRLDDLENQSKELLIQLQTIRRQLRVM